ncbi:MAG TPA: hypothetical protein VLH85_04565 [Levilinea sp.]|nr:hypothetical protein [Levilinea sp.]
MKYAIVTWWDAAVPLAVYSIIWLLLSITVIFFAPATFAMAYIVAEILDETVPEPRVILRSLFTFFLKSWGWFLGNIFVTGLIWVNWSFYHGIGTIWSDGLSWFVASIAVLWFGIQFYTLPFYIIQEKKSLFLAWRNALFAALASPGYAFVLWVVCALLIAASAFLVLPIMLGAPALIMLINSVAVRERVKTFKAMMAEKNKPDDTGDGDSPEA